MKSATAKITKIVLKKSDSKIFRVSSVTGVLDKYPEGPARSGYPAPASHDKVM